MYQVLLVAYLLVALALIGLVLIQQGKGADMGASFGAGASNTVFGSSGAGNFLTRGTALLATAFIVISLILGNLSANQGKSSDEWENLGVETQTTSQSIAELPAGETAEPTELPVDEIISAPSVDADVPVADAAEKPAASESDLPK